MVVRAWLPGGGYGEHGDLLAAGAQYFGGSGSERKTGIEDKKIRSILYNAFKKGTIERIGRGIYTGK